MAKKKITVRVGTKSTRSDTIPVAKTDTVVKAKVSPVEKLNAKPYQGREFFRAMDERDNHKNRADSLEKENIKLKIELKKKK